MYADEAVDNILTARGDEDTMRLRALFYDDPTMANNHTYQSAIHDFVERGSRRTPPTQLASTTGLDQWDVALYGPAREGNVGLGFDRRVYAVEEIRELIVADLRAVTRKFADDVGLPERVSVGRWQSPGERIGASGSTHPMDPQWGQMTVNPGGIRYGRFGPGGMGGGSPKWFEAVVDPRKDIDFFMLSRTGQNYAEHEILMSPETWAEKAVGGLSRRRGSVDDLTAMDIDGPYAAPSSMPGLTSAQMELGPNAPRWLPRLIEELTEAGVAPDLVKRFIKEPAGRSRDALVHKVTTELDVARRNALEGQGWTNLPTPGAIRAPTVGDWPVGGETLRKIHAGSYDTSDWFDWGLDSGRLMSKPRPPNWLQFHDEIVDLFNRAGAPGGEIGSLAASRPATAEDARLAFEDWISIKDRGPKEAMLSGLVGWRMPEGAIGGARASMELLPGWKDWLKRLVDAFYDTPRGRALRQIDLHGRRRSP